MAEDRTGGARNLLLGRCAGVLFLAAGLASIPANQLLSDPEPGWWVHLLNLIAFASGWACWKIPWDRIDRRWLHVLPPLAVLEVVIAVWGLGVHGEVYLWYFLLTAVFVGYAFRRRIMVAAHMGVVGFGFASTAVGTTWYDPDALVRVLVAVPTLAVAAGVVAWLREGLEARERRLFELYEAHEREARTDALTGLANRRALMEALEPAVLPGARPRTLALFDLDGFKAYNDNHGHLAGDALLERLGMRLTDRVRGSGRAYRLGGDEFCILLDGAGPETAEAVAECVAALTDGVTGTVVTASYGAARIPAEAGTPSAALSAADRRMYRIKHERRRALRKEESGEALAPPFERRQGSRAPTAVIRLSPSDPDPAGPRPTES